MTPQCIHGFLTAHCASCASCVHGQMASACVRCRSAVASRKAPQPVTAQLPQQHAGYDIIFEPEVSGWRYRAADSAGSPQSYRSAFLARKAVDQLGTAAVAVKKPAKRR
jgi:hypothetical protein